MNKDVQARPVLPHFGAFILETLTMGMYGESRNAIREYVQNCFDSLRQAVRDQLLKPDEVRVDVTLNTVGRELVIRDNGSGLKASSAVDVLVSVGASKKDFRKNAGFRGIGRLAGIVFCDIVTFTTKAKGDDVITTVEFDAKKLRELLEPENNHDDAATTLGRCVKAFVTSTADVDGHFFEVRLTGFHQPPKECLDATALKSFLTQVSPLPYTEQFPHAAQILEQATRQGKEIEVIRLFLQSGDGAFEELFKPYGPTYSVKKVQAPLTDIDFVASPTGKWWGWVGRKRVSGAIKDADTRGIRVRARNIQIDGTDIMRDIFTNTYEDEKPRLSYARFAEWYVGEVFVEPGVAVPNARRDGFEEDANWIEVRRELGVVGEKYGRLAYKVSAAEQISLPTLTSRLTEMEASAKRLAQDASANWELVAPVAEGAREIQRRLTKASSIASDDEGSTIYALSTRLGQLRYDLSRIATAQPPAIDCAAEISKAKSELTQKIFAALREGLGPAEWGRARKIVHEATGEDAE
jgi:molecular chaperone HtpG